MSTIIYDDRSFTMAARAVLATNPAARRNFSSERDMIAWVQGMTDRDLGTSEPGYWSTFGVMVTTWLMDNGMHAKASVDAYVVLKHLRLSTATSGD